MLLLDILLETVSWLSTLKLGVVDLDLKQIQNLK